MTCQVCHNRPHKEVLRHRNRSLRVCRPCALDIRVTRGKVRKVLAEAALEPTPESSAAEAHRQRRPEASGPGGTEAVCQRRVTVPNADETSHPRTL